MRTLTWHPGFPAGLRVIAVLVVAACHESVLTPAGGGWPHEPAGFKVMSDEPFDALTENGWYAAERQTINGSGLSLATDAAAPRSPPGVLAFKYAVGYEGGSEPGLEFYAPATPVRETYFAFWWKPSNPWQDHPSDVNTIADLFAASSEVVFIGMSPTASGYTINVDPEFSGDTRILAPNVTATPVVLGAWHQIEWYVKYSTTATSHDGVTRWWLDGVLQGEYTDLQMPGDAGFIEYAISPTWGGSCATKTETDFFWYDHAHISTP